MNLEQILMGLPMMSQMGNAPVQVIVIDNNGLRSPFEMAAPRGIRGGMPLGIPVGIPVPHPSVFAPRQTCQCNERNVRTSRWEREIERTTPLKMEVMEDRGSQLIETNKRLSAQELDFHVNRFNEMRAEKTRKDAMEARAKQSRLNERARCHKQACRCAQPSWNEEEAIEELIEAMARTFGRF